MSDVAVVLPALDEEGAVADAVTDFQAQGARVVVVDNGSTDRTAERARQAGAEVVMELRRGYGSACQAGVRHLEDDPPAIVVFADCDGTLDPADLPDLLVPLRDHGADLVLGRRTHIEPGALPARNQAARWGCVGMFALLYGRRLHDLPPYRAVTWTALQRIAPTHPTYGYPVETVARALRAGLRVAEVPTRYRHRLAGESKVGTGFFDSLKVGLIMAWTTARMRFGRPA